MVMIQASDVNNNEDDYDINDDDYNKMFSTIPL
jgi:hypothetical protein